MPYFSFSLKQNFLSKDELLLLNISQPELNKIYFSKNTNLWKHLNKKKFATLPAWAWIDNKEIKISSTEIRKQRELLRGKN